MKNTFFCKECDFKTQKQSSYTRHLETNKHKQKCNNMCIKEHEDNVSELSTHSGSNSNSNSNDTIEKDKYIELLKEQINNLKEQLKDKDEIIKMLKNNQNNQPITQNKNNDEDDNSSCKSNKDIKLSTDALTIEEYYDNIKNGINNPFLIQETIRTKPENKNGSYDEEGIEYDEWGEVVEPVNENILILKSVDIEDYPNDGIKLYTKLVIDGLKSLNKNKRPIVCSNKTLKRFWVNTREKGWVKMEEEDINKVFYEIIGCYYKILGKALVNTGRFGENKSLKFNQQYNISYELYKAGENGRKSTQTLSYIFFRVDKEDYEIITKHIRSKLLDKDM